MSRTTPRRPRVRIRPGNPVALSAQAATRRAIQTAAIRDALTAEIERALDAEGTWVAETLARFPEEDRTPEVEAELRATAWASPTPGVQRKLRRLSDENASGPIRRIGGCTDGDQSLFCWGALAASCFLSSRCMIAARSAVKKPRSIFHFPLGSCLIPAMGCLPVLHRQASDRS